MKEREPRERELRLKLTDIEVVGILRYAQRLGTTPEEILEGFICDLVACGRRHGSDEADLAERYVERVGYQAPGIVRAFLAIGEDLENCADAQEYLKDLRAELGYYAAHPEDPDGTPAHLLDLRQEAEDTEERLREIYDSAAEWLREEGERVPDYNEAMRAVRECAVRFNLAMHRLLDEV